MFIPDVEVVFVEHISNSGENRDFHSVKFLDRGLVLRKFNFVGNVDDFENLKQNDRCIADIKLRFGREKESYVLKSADIISIKKLDYYGRK